MPRAWSGLQIALAGVPITAAGATTIVLSAHSDGELVPEGVLFTTLAAGS